MVISKAGYLNMLADFGLSAQEAHKLYWYCPEDVNQRPGFDYLEEFRDHYLKHNFTDDASYLKCIGDNGERFILFPSYVEEPGSKNICETDDYPKYRLGRVLIDPWELIDRKFKCDFEKIKETVADHIFFEILYQIPSKGHVYEETRYSILKMLELCNLYPTTDASTIRKNQKFHYITGEYRISKNRFCLMCGARLRYGSDNDSSAYTCINDNGEKFCFNNFQRSALLEWMQPHTKLNKLDYAKWRTHFTTSGADGLQLVAESLYN